MTQHQTDATFRQIGLDDIFGQWDPHSLTSPATDLRNVAARADGTSAYLRDIGQLAQTHLQAQAASRAEVVQRYGDSIRQLLPKFGAADLPKQFSDYLVDYTQRSVLFLDTLRRRGNQFVQHEQEGCPPVLAYDYEIVINGRDLSRPVNYSLVRIKAPAGVETRENARPYIIIDPRAGHGSGIGGFKSESEVGVALASGHPVYFVIFTTHPTPTQTLADVCRAEASFVREVRRRHSGSPKPIIIGNCQGGWAAMLLAATNPDLTGPVVVNGAPLSYWSGVRGKNPMRYLGGISGGVLPALVMSDLGNGEFDGANLVLNFESLNPGNSWWRKYYDLFAKGEEEIDRYLQFERWWSGFYFMNENEIRWVVQNLFVGNKLARGGANLDSRLHVDLRNVRAPIIVFASHGDNITPVPQALNWIADIYSSVQEIKARGQRIVYTVHDSIGHLGIFVASSVANKQHKEIVSTLKTIEALAPGLYEMKIVDVVGEGLRRVYEVAFEERSVEDILAYSDDRSTERPFEAIARVSEINSEIYDLTLRPMVKAMVSKASAKVMVDTQPLRMRRYAISDKNPLMIPLAPLAQAVHENRRPVASDNLFAEAERFAADIIGDCWNLYRDWRDSMMENWVVWFYGSPFMQALTGSGGKRISEAPADDLRTVPEVHQALENIDNGGFPEAVIRMLVMLAHSRGAVRRDRLERSNHLLTSTEPFASLGVHTRNKIIHRQSIIVDFEPEQALATLSLLLTDPEDRQRALAICQTVAGPQEEMEESTIEMFTNLRQALDLPEGPAAATTAAAAPAPARSTRSKARVSEPTNG